MPIDNIFGIRINENIKEKLENKPFLIRILKNLELWKWENQQPKIDFFNDVSYDIQKLRQFNQEYGNMPEAVIKIHNDELIWMKNVITKKYTKDYCPCGFFRYFTKSNKMQYLFLRVEIDKLLKIDNTRYII